MRLRDMQGLGPKSEQQLQAIGILTPDDLRETGAVQAFIKLAESGHAKPSLNFLYAMVGALEGRHWTEVAREERGRLLFELQGCKELEDILRTATQAKHGRGR